MQDSNSINPNFLPPSAFYFAVKFLDTPDMDSSFQEVSGLKVALGTESREGGDNQFIHYVPKPPTFSDLILKRSLLPNQNLNKWCKNAFENFVFDPKDIHLSLMGADGVTLASWNIKGAYPVSWELAVLDRASNELAIEALVLKYSSFKKEPL
ncbi:phage tail protein [Aequorivita lipolytica]|uniref:Phage tail protein n=1 Tax=Aequorivita lipolytica TaxID=153267 RepID=A0A5C6YNR3_9FLAO|nr:phage tail protein [Aequorivita lipolytica]TXD68980.1 phage tail protein [Aequorivita lipolytica]SRX53013.1 hypothetical protein AEQU2_02269 [Aequorivita lipolytica]